MIVDCGCGFCIVCIHRMAILGVESIEFNLELQPRNGPSDEIIRKACAGLKVELQRPGFAEELKRDPIVPRQMMGRLSDGRARDHGKIVHATIGTASYCHGKAICGAKPGPRSAGWSDAESAVTCPKCLKKMAG
jgi:hypothetical protein